MNEHDAMLQAIYDNLDDDMVRLAYADWLDEHADTRIRCKDCLGTAVPIREYKGKDGGWYPCTTCHCHGSVLLIPDARDRAELIRLQYELQKAPEYRYLRIEHGLADGVSYQCKKAYALRVREEQLIKSHPEWVPHGLGLTNARVHWRTGFIEKIEVPLLTQIFEGEGPTAWVVSLVASIPTLTRLIPLDQVPDLEEGGYEWYDLEDRLLTMITKQTFTTPEQAVDALGREIVLQIKRFIK